MIPEHQAGVGTGVKTVVAAHEAMATWLVGWRGPHGGAGGFAEAFDNEVVMPIGEELEGLARGIDTLLMEANWFRRVCVAQTRALGRFASDTRLSLAALGNAVGFAGDNIDRADRESRETLHAAASCIEVFGWQRTNPGG
jgi:hypothetical protein